MNEQKRILLLGGGNEGLEVLEKAHDIGLSVVVINQREKFREAHARYVEHALLTDYSDLERTVAFARALNEITPFSGVISLSEAALVPAAHVGEALGLLGNSIATVTMLKEKPLMRERLAALGLSPVTTRRGSTRHDVERFLSEHGGPIIVKPTNGSGSRGVFRIEDSNHLDRIWPEVQNQGLSSFLVEEYLDGPEISVESFTYHGRHVIVTATEKLTLPETHVEIGHAVPADLDPSVRSLVNQLVEAFLDAMGLVEGPAHTEIRLTSRGPRIIESHNRNGGGRINELVRLAFGFDIKATALAWACGLGEASTEPPSSFGGAAIRFFTPRPGRVRKISGAESLSGRDGFVELRLLVGVGDQVKPIRSSDDRCGYVIATGADVREAIRRCEEMIASVEIVTE